MTSHRSLRTFFVALVLVLSAVAALSFAGTAGAATKCGKKVLADWYDNGRIDKLYPLNCYEEAIDAIPDDIGPYVDAEDVITRALQGALRGKLDAGGCDPTADGSADDCARNPGRANGNGGNGNGTGNDADNGGERRQDDPGQVAPAVDTSGPVVRPDPAARARRDLARAPRRRRPRIRLATPPGRARRRRRRRRHRSSEAAR